MIAVSRALAIALLAILIAGCSFLGMRPTPTPPLATSVPLTKSATPTPEPTIVVATAEMGTIQPETFDPNATPTPLPPATPFPTSQPTLIAGLIYQLVGVLGLPDWCDPDFYPVAHAEELDLARERLAEMQADEQLYTAILDHNGIARGSELTDDQLVAVYRDWKILTKAVVLSPAAGGYEFDYTALRGPIAQQMDYHVAGTISADGQITKTTDEPTTAPNCPICLARGTLIATPSGDVPVQDLAVGMTVWTADENGQPVAAPIAEVRSTLVPQSHRVVHLVLSDGRTLDVSPGHPLSDGRLVGGLTAGDVVDGSTVISTDLISYAGGATFDLLPFGSTGSYWANGILIGSTLKQP